MSVHCDRQHYGQRQRVVVANDRLCSPRDYRVVENLLPVAGWCSGVGILDVGDASILHAGKRNIRRTTDGKGKGRVDDEDCR